MKTIVKDLLKVLRHATDSNATDVDVLRGIGAIAEHRRIRKRLAGIKHSAVNELRLRLKLTQFYADRLGRISPCAARADEARAGLQSERLMRRTRGGRVAFITWIHLFDKDGLHRGMAIPGSILLRDFCRGCGTAIRIEKSRLERVNYCELCGSSAPRAVGGSSSGPSGSSPSWDNAVRAYEDNS